VKRFHPIPDYTCAVLSDVFAAASPVRAPAAKASRQQPRVYRGVKDLPQESTRWTPSPPPVRRWRSRSAFT
jgi:hypothetical protein